MSAGNTSAEAPVRERVPLGVAAGHLAALWALAIVQPLFDLLGRNPEFFVARGNTGGDVLVFALAFALVPPLLLTAVEALVGRWSERWRERLHLALVGLLVAALALQAAKRLAAEPAAVLLVTSTVVGAAAAAAYARGGFLRSLLSVLVPAPVVVLLVFLVFSDVSKLVLPQEEAQAADVRVADPAPVVMVVLDELPTASLIGPGGGIDARRYPGFAALARAGTWYRDATTVAGFTAMAVPAVLTGRRPPRGALPTASEQPRNLFTLLGGSYAMNVMENATQLCPAELCPDGAENSVPAGRRLRELFADLRVVSAHLLLPNALRRGLPDISQTFGDFAAEAQEGEARFIGGGNAEQLAANFAAGVTEDEAVRVADFAAAIEPGPRPGLHMIHIEKPHYPWTHLPDGRRYTRMQSEFLPFFGDDSSWLASRAVTDLALQRHLLEAGYTDHLLRQVIRRLRETGLWDRALVVVVADHGGAFIPGVPRRNPRPANIGQVAPVPLFVKAPGQRRGRTVERHVCTTDVLPIIARLLGIRYTWARWPCPPREVVVEDEPPGEVRAPLAAVLRGSAHLTARIHRLFGSGWEGVYRFGPAPGLLGAAAGGAPSAASAAAELDDPQALEDVDLRAPTVAALLQRGGLTGVEPGEVIAIAVNGRVAATGTSFEQEDEVRFSILLPPGSLRPGHNAVAVLRVTADGRLERLDG